jgi:hypothetical protein
VGPSSRIMNGHSGAGSIGVSGVKPRIERSATSWSCGRTRPGSYREISDAPIGRRALGLPQRRDRHGQGAPGALELGIAIAVLRDGLSAPSARHREGIVHGDVKPSNISRVAA